MPQTRINFIFNGKSVDTLDAKKGKRKRGLANLLLLFIYFFRYTYYLLIINLAFVKRMNPLQFCMCETTGYSKGIQIGIHPHPSNEWTP